MSTSSSCIFPAGIRDSSIWILDTDFGLVGLRLGRMVGGQPDFGLRILDFGGRGELSEQ
jgi:hypothetical protein